MVVLIFLAVFSTVSVNLTGSPPFPIVPDSINVGEAELLDLQENLLGWYLQEGYPFASVVLYFSASDTLTINTIPGRHASLERVMFPDSVRTNRNILLRDLSLSSNSQYSSLQVTDWLSKLQKYPFVESAGPPQVFLGESGNVVLLVPVTEAPVGWFSGDLGFSSTGGFLGGGEIVFTNIFGTGRRMELSASAVEWGGIDTEALYHEPWILGSPFSAELNIKQEVPDSGSVIREWSADVIMSLGSISISSGYGVWKSWPLNQDEESFKYGSAGILFDFTEVTRQGSDGFSGSIRSETGSAVGADSTYFLSRVDAELDYQTFFSQLGFGVKAKGGGIVSGDWLSSMVTRLGGYGTLRGYVEDSWRAGVYSVFSPEISLGETTTQLYAFSDIGFLKTPDTGMEYPFSAGIGLRGKAGGLYFDAGSAFPVSEGLSAARFYLSARISL